MESSILSEVDDTSILRTGLPTPLWPSSQLATGLSPLAPRSGLERSDFVLWHIFDISFLVLKVRCAPDLRCSLAIETVTAQNVPEIAQVVPKVWRRRRNDLYECSRRPLALLA